MNKSLISRGAALYFWAVVFFACAVILADSFVRVGTIEKITAVSFRAAGDSVATGAKGTRPEFLVLPESSMDAKWWILHAEDLLGKPDWRVRHTSLDNAPDGRGVHWSSGLVWMLAGGAKAVGMVEGSTPSVSHVVKAALFAGPVLYALAGILLGALVWRASGCGASGLFAAAFFSTPSIYRTFHLGEADHHGIVMTFLMASVWCLWAGWSRIVDLPKNGSSQYLKRIRPWIVASGIFGGSALWVSAATALPVLVAAGFGGLAAIWSCGKQANFRCGHPWAVWGISGSAASLVFYLLEYFPSEMGFRLEVNHPLYAMGWLGAGFLMDWIASRRAGAVRSWKDWRLPGGLILIIIPAVVFILGRERFFWVADPFLLALHREYILEFQSLSTFLRTMPEPWTFLMHQGWTLFAVLAASLSIAFGWFPKDRIPLLPLLFFPAIGMQLLALDQVRWAYAASGLWTLCGVAVVVGVPSEARPGRGILVGLAGFTALFALLLSLTPQLVASIHKEKTCLDAPIDEKVGNGLLLRDIAHRLMESSPERVPVVLTGPNSSTELAFHARLKTLGTLYWENMPGLKRAARVFAAPDEESARALIQEAGVTHIVIPSWENFGGPYARLYSIESGLPAHPEGAPFFKDLFEDRIFPQWLRPFAYPIPTSSGIDGSAVRIFAVLPGQNAFEHAWFQGMYFHETGRPELAREWVGRARDLRPEDPRPRAFLQQTNPSNL